MPFPFTLPTTSHLTFQSHLTSPTHPSLPVTTTTIRNALRSAFKSHKRLSSSQQITNLSQLLTILDEYIPYLLTLDAGLSGKSVSGEAVNIDLLKEVEVEWRPTLLSSTPLPGRDPRRIKGRGLDYEIHYVLHALSTVHHLLARSSHLKLHIPSSASSTAPTPEERTSFLQNATKHLLTAHAIQTHLLHLTHNFSDGPSAFPKEAIDIHPTTQSCLAELSRAEATLLFVLKDDPYPALLQQSRDKNDREWMVKAPDIPRVRAHLFARLCIGAGEHAGKAAVAARGATAEREGGGKCIVKEMSVYCKDLKRVARAKGCRFLGVDAEASGKTGEGIAWLRGGMAELGMDVPDDGRGGEKLSFGRLKSTWLERREDRKIEKGKMGEWGADAGMAEEGRILQWLERKWTKQNDTMNVQIVPDFAPLVMGTMPSGREAFGSHPSTWSPQTLGEDVLATMRAPFDMNEGELDDEESSGDEIEGDERRERRPLAGAFPGATRGYDADSYY